MRGYRRKGRLYRIAILLLTLLPLCVLFWVGQQMRRVFMEYAINLCEDSAIQQVNDVMERDIYVNPALAKLVRLEYDAEKRITALQTDTAAIGQLKTRLVNELFERIDNLEQATVEVPLGSVFAPELFGGMGPALDVGFSGLTQVEAEFISAFTTAGINQTRHQIIIEVKMGFRILTQVGGVDREIVTRYPVTDTVLLGTVPERYAYIGEGGSGRLGEVLLDAPRE